MLRSLLLYGFLCHLRLAVSLYYCTCDGSLELLRDKADPMCYCDAICELFNDCCLDFPENSNISFGNQEKNITTDESITKEPEIILRKNEHFTHANDSFLDSFEKTSSLNLVQRFPPLLMDTCLRIDESTSGVWILNKCLKSGKKCSRNMTMSDVIMHLPVTDNQNVTYFGAECAICNGITNFTAWGLLSEFNLLQVDGLANATDTLSLVEDIDFETIQPNLEKIGPIKLIPPPMLTYRICHIFSSKEKQIATNGCPNRQCKTSGYSIGVEVIFKTPACCLSAEVCETAPKFAQKTIEHLANLRFLHLIGSRYSYRQVVYTFPGAIQEPCKARKEQKRGCKVNCTYYNACLPSKFEFFNYLLRDRTLTLIMDGNYDSILTTLALNMVSTYLWKTKWFLKFLGITPVYHSHNEQCIVGDRMCTKVELPMRPMSTNILNYQEVKLVELMTENMTFDLYINISSYRKIAFGVLSRNAANISSCKCNEGNFLRDYEMERPFYHVYNIDRKTLRNYCIDSKLILKSENEWGKDVGVLEVHCKHDFALNASFETKNYFCFAFFVVLHFYVVVKIV